MIETAAGVTYTAAAFLRISERGGVGMKIAIVGAGIAGSSCAEALQHRGHTVMLFDKGRRAGGRMATRRVVTPLGDISFDHGAQYFTARDAVFVAQVEQWVASGVVAAWPGAGDDAWVGTPGMSALVEAIVQRLDVRWTCRINEIHDTGLFWALGAASDQRFDAVIIATPAEQAVPLLIAHDREMAATAHACASAPCWTVMVAFGRRVAIAADVIRDDDILGWAARNSAKPGRRHGEAWVLQATPHWSLEHLEDQEASVVDALLDALAAKATQALPEANVRIGHRWRYARAEANPDGFLWNSTKRIGAVGDWLTAPRIESAWLSGRMLADRIGNS